MNRYRRGKWQPRAENPEGEAPTDKRPKAPVSPEKARDKVFAYALKLLAAKSRSEQQLRDKLASKAWIDAAFIDDAIARLKEMGYVNDRAFALNYATSRLALKSIGRARLARELAEKQLSRDVVEETLSTVFEEVAEEDLLERAIEKQMRMHGKPTDEKSLRRLYAYLMRRGFPYDQIIKKVRAVRFAEEAD